MYRASHDKDEKAIFDLSFATRCTIDKIRCEGCGSGADDRFVLTNGCIYRRCAGGKGLESCAFCAEYPCESLSYLLEEGTDRIRDAQQNSKRMKEAGIDTWLDEAAKRWQCRKCGVQLSVGSESCKACGEPLKPY